MTVEFWRDAELFYEFWFVVLSSAVVFMAIVLLFVFAYAKKANRLKSALTVLGIAAILGLIGLRGHHVYQPYLEQASYVNPLIRDREPKLHMYTYISNTEQAVYAQLNHIDALRHLVLYEEEQITEPLIYLGQGEHTHYFERLDGEWFRHNRQIEFTETAERPQLVGSRFILTDDAFKELGFKNPKNTMYDYIEIPAAEQGKVYEPKDESEFQRAENVIRDWNFR